MYPDIRKFSASDLAALGGQALFARPLSAVNAAKPDIEKFLGYSRIFHDARHYTNDGPLVKLLEKRLAAFHGTRHCIAFANGFWALVLAVKCLALAGRPCVVMPSLAERELADAVDWCGLVPKFCEVDPTTLAMTAELAAACVDADTALILGVHPAVDCCDAAGLEALARSAGVPLVLHATESAFETIAGRKVGSFGAAECFSMHASKLINGFEGGYVTTDDAALAHRLAKMRGFGFFGQDNIENLGLNAKLNEIHAAMALTSLDELDEQVLRNAARYRGYAHALDGLAGIRLLAFDERERCGFKSVVVELRDDWPLSRDQTVALLNRERVPCKAYCAPALHQRPSRQAPVSLPTTELLAERYLLLPSGPQVSGEDIAAVASLLRFLRQHAADILERLPS